MEEGGLHPWPVGFGVRREDPQTGRRPAAMSANQQWLDAVAAGLVPEMCLDSLRQPRVSEGIAPPRTGELDQEKGADGGGGADDRLLPAEAGH